MSHSESLLQCTEQYKASNRPLRWWIAALAAHLPFEGQEVRKPQFGIKTCPQMKLQKSAHAQMASPTYQDPGDTLGKTNVNSADFHVSDLGFLPASFPGSQLTLSRDLGIQTSVIAWM